MLLQGSFKRCACLSLGKASGCVYGVSFLVQGSFHDKFLGQVLGFIPCGGLYECLVLGFVFAARALLSS